MSYWEKLSESMGPRGAVCHVCSNPIWPDDQAITHDGVVGATSGNNYGTLHLHPECATILVLRLSADVMKQKPVVNGEPRVLHTLRDTRRALSE